MPFRRSARFALMLLLAFGAAAQEVVFDTVEEGRRRIREDDGFLSRTGDFERATRLKTNGPVTAAQFADFLAGTVREWSPQRRAKVQQAFDAIQPALARLALPLPKPVHLVHTTGEGEGYAAYTRGEAVILPTGDIDRNDDLKSLLAHELFHVASRANPAMRDRVYAAIGFEPCGEVLLPPALRARRLTNPDAPVDRHAIRVEVDGSPVWAVPVIHLTPDANKPGQRGEFFDHLVSELLVVERTAAGGNRVPGGPSGKRVSMDDAKGFWERVGRNTTYAYHPEEILADNFAMLATGAKGAKSPEVLERVRKAIAGPGKTRPD